MQTCDVVQVCSKACFADMCPPYSPHPNAIPIINISGDNVEEMLAKRIEKSFRRRIDVMMNVAPELEKLYNEHKNNRTPRIIRQKPSKVVNIMS